jgi:uncharacterized protein (TIGR00369 family)
MSTTDLDPETAERIKRMLASQPPFAALIGWTMTEISRERIVAEMVVRPDLENGHGVVHGGALMALADHLGGMATIVNLPRGAITTTIESKTNFFAGVPLGETLRAECTALHKGRTTMVWQTRITRADGRLAALVTQTQLVMERKS